MDGLVNPDAARLARERGFGGTAEVHTAQTRYTWVPVVSMATTGLAFLVFAVTVLLEGDAIVSGVLATLLALGVLGAAGWKARSMRATGVEQVYLFSGGLVYTARNRTEALAWSEITAVWRTSIDVHTVTGRLVRRERNLTLEKDAMAHISLTERFAGIESITRSVYRGVTPIQLGRARERLAAGQPVIFPLPVGGDLVVDGQAVTQGKTRIPIAEIRAVETENGSLVIEGQRTLKVTASWIRNLPVLLSLLGVPPRDALH